MPTLAVLERARLADTAQEVGPDAPTLCGDWTVLDLLAHLVVREGDLLAAPGIVVPPLAFLTERAMERVERQGPDALLQRLRRPPLWSPFRLPGLDRLVNTLELFVHHEDIRRAQPGWTARDLSDADQRAIWRALGLAAKPLVRPARVPVSIRWPGSGSERVQVLARGADPVVVSGPPAELAMFLFGRDQHAALDFDGPDGRVTALREAPRGL